ncbi:MAG: hypothetical protein IPM82_20175 [Saprospiraceae bacterium]|nr:hypothetical protein [Saprospiraceae bacterium]
MVMGQVMIGLILHFAVIVYTEAPAGMTMGQALKYGVPVLVLFGFVASRVVDRKLADGAGVQPNLLEKLAHFRRRKIVGWAIQEGSNLAAVVLAVVFQYQFFMLCFALGVMAFIWTRPSLEAFTEEYRLTPAERQIVENEAFSFLK